LPGAYAAGIDGAPVSRTSAARSLTLTLGGLSWPAGRRCGGWKPRGKKRLKRVGELAARASESPSTARRVRRAYRQGRCCRPSRWKSASPHGSLRFGNKARQLCRKCFACHGNFVPLAGGSTASRCRSQRSCRCMRTCFALTVGLARAMDGLPWNWRPNSCGSSGP